MHRPNTIMLDAGYVPAADVARVLHKAVSTVHRMAEEQRIEGTRDGRALYISLASLRDCYADNPAILAVIEENLNVAPNDQPACSGSEAHG